MPVITVDFQSTGIRPSADFDGEYICLKGFKEHFGVILPKLQMLNDQFCCLGEGVRTSIGSLIMNCAMFRFFISLLCITLEPLQLFFTILLNCSTNQGTVSIFSE